MLQSYGYYTIRNSTIKNIYAEYNIKNAYIDKYQQYTQNFMGVFY